MLPVLLALAIPFPPFQDVPSHVETYSVDGVERQAVVQPGTGAAPKGGRPLVFGFHGHGGNMRYSERKYDVHALWPEAIVIYPEGLPTKGMTDPNGTKNGWQQKAGDNGDRDLKFVDAMLARTKGYDPRRVFSMGHSNGGRFTYVLWAERGDRFAAFGPSASPALFPTSRMKPAPFLATAGENDPLIPYRIQMRGVQALATANGVDLGKATKTGYLTLGKGPTGLEAGTYVFPGGHEYPAEAIAATIALFKRSSR